MFARATDCYHNNRYVHSVSRNMTGSVSGETQSKATGKCDKPTDEKSTEPQTESSSPPNNSPTGDETSSKKTPLLPPLVVEPPSSKEPGGEALEKTTDREFLTLPRAGGPCKKKQLHHSSKSASSLSARSRMDELALLGASSLARRGRAQSYLTLAGGAADPVFGVLAGDDRGFEDSLGARSELSAPVSAARSRRRRGDVRAYGTLERATSYSSLAATPPRPTFRSANSTRPSPAPPCTTTHMDFSRHPVHPASTFSSAAAGSRLPRAGTPRRNNPHPVGLHFQSPYNRDGKTFEVWDPNETLVANRLPQMCQHIEKTNFTSGKMTCPPTNQCSGGSPDRHHSGSVYQLSYRSPQGLTDYDHRMPTTRFGSTFNRAAAVGVVPNVMSPRCGGRRVKLHIPRGQKLESLV